MNSKSSKIFDLRKLLLKLPNKIDLRRNDKYIVLSNLRKMKKYKNKS